MTKKKNAPLDNRKTRLAMVGIPLDYNSSYLKGAASAPPRIREALHCYSSNLWSEEGIDLGADGFITDAGDINFSEKEDDFITIQKKITELLDQELIPISLGGDHSVSHPIIKAISVRFPAMDILHFDAHPDLYHDFEGNPRSHACPFSRIMEENLCQHLLQLGIRTLNDHQRDQARKFSVDSIEMKDWNDKQELKFKNPLYISFDMDALDPAFAPGVSHPEPGGFSTRQVIQIIQHVSAPRIIGADICEYNPEKDPTGITAMTAAKILKEIAGKILQG
jgi:agmatinase